MMNIDLMLITGVVYACVGALIMLISYRALYRRAARIMAGYPRVLAELQTHRHDSRFGLIFLLCGNVLQGLAAFEHAVAPEHWRYPACAAAVLLAAYGVWRFFATRQRSAHVETKPTAAKTAVRHAYETRRSIRLLDAARHEAANARAGELVIHPRDRSVVYVSREWECRWWSDRLGVSPAALKAAVRQVGPMVPDLERHFSVTSRPRCALAA